MRVFVLTGTQVGLAGFVQAFTTTEVLVAQDTMKPNWLVCAPKLGPLFRMRGFGRNHNAPERPTADKNGPHPMVPGK